LTCSRYAPPRRRPHSHAYGVRGLTHDLRPVPARPQDVAQSRVIAGPAAAISSEGLLQAVQGASEQDLWLLHRLAASAAALVRCVASGELLRLPFLLRGSAHFVAAVVQLRPESGGADADLHVFEQEERVPRQGPEQLQWPLMATGVRLRRRPRFLAVSLQVRPCRQPSCHSYPHAHTLSGSSATLPGQRRSTAPSTVGPLRCWPSWQRRWSACRSKPSPTGPSRQ
jgi:hypothetical protein